MDNCEQQIADAKSLLHSYDQLLINKINKHYDADNRIRIIQHALLEDPMRKLLLNNIIQLAATSSQVPNIILKRHNIRTLSNEIIQQTPEDRS